MVHPNFGEVIKMGIAPNTDFTEGKPIEYIKPEAIKIEFDMPEYGQLTEAATRAGWTYNEATRVATLEKRGSDVPTIYGKDWTRGGDAGMTSWGWYINMVNAPFNEASGEPKIYTINSRYWVTNPGEPEKKLTDRSSRFYIEPVYFQPGVNFYSIKDNYTGTGTSEDGSTYDLNEGNHVYIDGKITDRTYGKTEEGMPYQLYLAHASNGLSYDNPYGGDTAKIWDIQDRLISNGDTDRLYYKSFLIASANEDRRGYPDRWSAEKKKEALDKTKADLDGENTLYGILADGNTEVIAQNIKLGQKIEINDTTGKYKGLRLSWVNPVELNHTGIKFITRALPTQVELDKFDNGTYDRKQSYRGDFFINKTTSAPGVNGDRPTTAVERWERNGWGDHYAENLIGKPAPKVSLWNIGHQSVVFKTGGSEFEHWAAFHVRKNASEWGPLAKEPLENVKLIKLPPAGFAFKEVRYKNWYDKPSGITGPEVVENFRNTGRTAVIYSFEKLVPENGGFDDAHIGTTMVATKFAERGNNRIDSFLVYPRNHLIKPNSGGITYKDELFARTSTTVNYIPPLELVVKKEVAYDNTPTTEWSSSATGDLSQTLLLLMMAKRFH